MPDPYTSPSPPPAPSAARRRRHRRRHLLLSPFSAAARTSPSAASSSASSPASSLFSFSRSPSPFHHRFLSPLHAAASAVPFAWEHRPGVPKTPVRQFRASSRSASANKALPLPPSHRILSGSKVGADDYDFSAAAGNGNDCCFVVPDDGVKERLGRRVRRRQPALAAATLTDCLAVLRLCQSCARSRDCLAETPPPQRRHAVASEVVTGWSGYY